MLVQLKISRQIAHFLNSLVKPRSTSVLKNKELRESFHDISHTTIWIDLRRDILKQGEFL